MNRKARIIKIAIVVTLFLAAYMVIMWIWIITPAPPVAARITRQLTAGEKAWSKERMNHHGIMSFTCDAGGECYFYRNGQRCRL